MTTITADEAGQSAYDISYGAACHAYEDGYKAGRQGVGNWTDDTRYDMHKAAHRAAIVAASAARFKIRTAARDDLIVAADEAFWRSLEDRFMRCTPTPWGPVSGAALMAWIES